MLSRRVERAAVEYGEPARSNVLRTELRINLRIVRSDRTLVDQVRECSREPKVLGFAHLEALSNLQVRLREPRSPERARRPNGDGPGCRILCEVCPFSATGNKSWERAWKGEANVQITGLRRATIGVGEQAEVG